VFDEQLPVVVGLENQVRAFESRKYQSEDDCFWIHTCAEADDDLLCENNAEWAETLNLKRRLNAKKAKKS
jgi:hypothetical protein